jgi:hypothetical protein
MQLSSPSHTHTHTHIHTHAHTYTHTASESLSTVHSSLSLAIASHVHFAPGRHSPLLSAASQDSLLKNVCQGTTRLLPYPYAFIEHCPFLCAFAATHFMLLPSITRCVQQHPSPPASDSLSFARSCAFAATHFMLLPSIARCVPQHPSPQAPE